MANESPRTLLANARRLIAEPDPRTRGLWARAAALLARQALEGALGELWDRKAPPLADASFAVQLTCFPQYIGDSDVARIAAHAWAALSDACHHRGYALAPTAAELEAWFRDVERALDALKPADA